MTTFLLNIPIFHALSKEDLKLIPILLKPFSAKKGEPIYRQGDPGGGMYVLKKGTVNLFIRDFNGKDVPIRTVRPHETFGELSLFDDIPRVTQAIAEEDVTGFFLPTEHFRNLTVLSGKTMLLSLQRGFTENFRLSLHHLCMLITQSPAGKRIVNVEPVGHFDFGKKYSVEKTLDESILKKLDCFSHYTLIEIDALIRQMNQWELPKRCVLFDPAQQSDSCYFIVRGAVRLLNNQGYQSRQLAVFGPGMMLRQHTSEGILFPGITCETAEKCFILELPSHVFCGLFYDETIINWKFIRHYNESLVRIQRILFSRAVLP